MAAAPAMTSRSLTIAGFLVIGAVWVAFQVLARSRRSGMLTFGQWIDLVMSLRYGRVGVLLVWWWLGWHFLAR
jgi:hypothetical protein